MYASSRATGVSTACSALRQIARQGRPSRRAHAHAPAHAPGQLDMLDYGCERAELAGIEPERIINTWPKEKLLAWAEKS